MIYKSLNKKASTSANGTQVPSHSHKGCKDYSETLNKTTNVSS